jgi:hypothetical protein
MPAALLRRQSACNHVLERGSQRREALRSDTGSPLRFQRSRYLVGGVLKFPPPRCQSHNASAPVAGIRVAFEVTVALELAEHVIDSLLTETSQLGDLTWTKTVDAGPAEELELSPRNVWKSLAGDLLIEASAVRLPSQPQQRAHSGRGSGIPMLIGS